jgi:cytochrome P450
MQPMPPWSWLSGLVLHLYTHSRRLPADASIDLSFLDMASDFQDDEMFLIWPLSEPMLTLFNPDAAFDVCQKLNLPKAQKNEDMLTPITGGNALLSMNDETWKFWRGLFNAGFSSGVITEQVPHIVGFVEDMCEQLERCVGGDFVCLDELTIEMTFKVILNISL